MCCSPAQIFDSKAIAQLVKIPNLRSLAIHDTRIKSSDLVGFAPARKLWHLSLAAQQNDDGYSALSHLANVFQLQLYNASADDLLQLAEVKQLRTLWLLDPVSVDEHEVAKLHAANPLCRVLVGYPKKGICPVGSDPIAEQRGSFMPRALTWILSTLLPTKEHGM